MSEIKEDVSLRGRKKLPMDIKHKRRKVLFKNLIIAIIISLYFFFINLGFFNIENSLYIIFLKVFSIIILGMSIVLFEKGYKEDNEGIFLYGVEVLAVALMTILTQYKLFDNTSTIQIVFNFSFAYFVIYYFIKSCFQMRKIKKEYALSDVKELVKEK